jgi:hypothetical protein
MSLIECPECKKEISSLAKACPLCGNPISSGTIDSGSEAISNRVEPMKNKPSRKMTLPGKIVLGLIVLLVPVWIINSGKNKSGQSPQPVPRSVSG